VKEYCDPESTFNFYVFHYCDINENLGIILPVGILIIILSFYILGTTADGYLSPSLETISSKLGMSESLAGVTFLAFANGAPDVVSALSASGGEADGIYLAIGALLGAGLFVTTVVAAVVILSAKKPIQVYPRVFLRDVGFYMLGPVILWISAATGKLSLPFSITFLVVYIIFVLVVVVSDKLGKPHPIIEQTVSLDISTLSNNVPRNDSMKRDLLDTEEDDLNPPKINDSKAMSQNDDNISSIFEDSQDIIGIIKHDHFEEHKLIEESVLHKFPLKNGFTNSLHLTGHKLSWGLIKMNRFILKGVKAEDPWGEMNWFQKIVYVLVDAPFDFLRRLTIPPANDEQWDRRFAMAFPLCSVIFFFLVSGIIDFQGPPPYLFYILLGIGA